MKTASLLIAALALALAAGSASAQTDSAAPDAQTTQRSGQPTRMGEKGPYTDYGQDMRLKKGTAQTYNTGPTGKQVGKDVYKDHATAKQVAPQVPANAADANRGARGTGVATGFVAAGIGLAILGLFVRKRGRHYDDEDDSRGSGTYTRM